MLRKVMPFHMKAVLWYQGEEDTAHAAVYAGLLKKLILCWRSGFMQHHLPFLIVQLPSFCETKDNVPAGSWASLRAAQSAIAAELPEVGLAVMIDQGEKYNVHPIDKRPVGRRLAMLAMKMLYGKDSGASPRAEHALWSGRDVLVTFDRNLRPAQDILCVEAEDAQGAWQTVSARAEAYGLAVSCNEKPLALRYACQDWCVQANLYGEDNLPVIPFQVEV
jgi:sialate O-acetylesterase